MNERLLQFIWQFQYFNKSSLYTNRGEKLEVIFQGQLNTNQGPDFLNARIRIDGTLMAGSVELHLKAEDWNRHGHEEDPNYNNVILQVLWQPAPPELLASLPFPNLVLYGLVPGLLLDKYEQLMGLSSFIPCQHSLKEIDALNLQGWKDRLVTERLMRKAALVEEKLKQNNFHWEETCWWLLARNFGMKVNADLFEAVARSLPLNLLARRKGQQIELEALMMGQAGLLRGRFRESYPRLLQKEYRYHQKKNDLKPVALPVHFLRMRPGNFPTLRLSQLASLLHQSDHLFSLIKETENLQPLLRHFDVAANDYWHYHYRFDEESSFKIKKIGMEMIQSLLLNTIVPLLFAYGNYYGEQKLKDKAMDWLHQCSPEQNKIIREFAAWGLLSRTGLDSQAWLELKTFYCDERKCLDCAIGNQLLKASRTSGLNSISPNPLLPPHPGAG